jgi:tetratricopeptide (TPR) repeat protein
MQEADPTTVLGDFDAARFTHFGVTSEFDRREGRFVVRTDGPDGEPAEFDVAYTFGVEPLQQYLIPLPGGRLQALSVAWDARPSEDGGQRWFHLYPDEPIPAGDMLHWTGINQNWNHMCAECHSTRVRKNYRSADDRYESTWFEIDVSCESCHGPGSAHATWAEAVEAGARRETLDVDMGLAVRLRDDAEWIFDAGAAIAHRSRPPESRVEVETCARCHARRGIVSEEYVHGRPLADTHRPALLVPGLYHADGQILDEVYVYGSFLQSRMYAAGVGCKDCHDPHALTFEGGPDATCGRCHRTEVFASPEHHHHKPDSTGASCVECHMPSRLYMVIDSRRDHSFRVPRPDLSLKLGTPNACTDCHSDQSVEWSADAAEAWYGSERAAIPHYGEVLHAGRSQLPGADARLREAVRDAARPGIVRATALELLGNPGDRASIEAVRGALRDPDPLVRAAAVRATEALEPSARLALSKPLLRDPVRTVRLEAARALLPVATALWQPAERATLADALAEYRASQLLQADRPEGLLNLGSIHAQMGELDEARRAYQRALRKAPWFVPGYVNLADVERQTGREDAAERALRRGLERARENPDLHHALGLSLVRQQRTHAAIESLRRASELAPDSPRYAYVYGVALHSVGEIDRALSVLDAAHRRFPTDRELLVALMTMSRDRGDRAGASRYALRLAELVPGDPGARGLLGEPGPDAR